MCFEGYVAYSLLPHRPFRGGRLVAFTLVRHARVCMRRASHCRGMHVARSDATAATDEHAGANARNSHSDRHARADPDSYSGAHRDSRSDADLLSHFHPGPDRDAHTHSTDVHANTAPRPHPYADPHCDTDAHPKAVDGVRARQVARERRHLAGSIREPGTVLAL